MTRNLIQPLVSDYRAPFFRRGWKNLQRQHGRSSVGVFCGARRQFYLSFRSYSAPVSVDLILLVAAGAQVATIAARAIVAGVQDYLRECVVSVMDKKSHAVRRDGLTAEPEVPVTSRTQAATPRPAFVWLATAHEGQKSFNVGVRYARERFMIAVSHLSFALKDLLVRAEVGVRSYLSPASYFTSEIFNRGKNA